MSNPVQNLLEAVARLASFGASAAEVAGNDDPDVMGGMRAYADVVRQLEPFGAWHAGVIAQRSDYERGAAGFARQQGYKNAEQLLVSELGTTWDQASKLVNAGTMMSEVGTAVAVQAAREAELAALAAEEEARRAHEDDIARAREEAARRRAEAEAAGDPEPEFDPEPKPFVPAPRLFNPLLTVDVSPDAAWQVSITEATDAGRLSYDQANAIRKGLGVVDEVITADLLQNAVRLLVTRVGSPAVMQRNAKILRDRMDVEAVQRQQKDRHDRRYLRVWERDGLVHGQFALDGPDAALMLDFYTKSTSSRRNGARATDPSEIEHEQKVLLDPRTPVQIAVDDLANLLQVGIDADPNTVLGSRPSVRVIVEETALTARTDDPDFVGTAQIENLTDLVSFARIEPALCDTGLHGLKFDEASAKCIDLGRDQRLFSPRQKFGMVVRDGGCRGKDCEKPASWCEAHHINFWSRDTGETNLDDGILLCRFHHGFYHHNNYEIERHGGSYWLKPPKSVDPEQTLQELPSRNPVVREMTDPQLRALIRQAWKQAAAVKAQQKTSPPPRPSAGNPNRHPTPMNPGSGPTRHTPAMDRVRFVPADTLWNDDDLV